MAPPLTNLAQETTVTCDSRRNYMFLADAKNIVAGAGLRPLVTA
jgi:hypothetical protein